MIRITLLASLCLIAQGFAPVPQIARPVAPLGAATQAFDEDDAVSLLNQAVDCSNSDTCSVQDAEWYLTRIVDIQSRCRIGALSDRDLCDNQQTTSEIVAQLRQKISSMGDDNALSPETIAAESQSFFVGGATLMFLVAHILTTNYGGHGTLAFTTDEWWWAFREGYLPLMLVHLIRDGGLIQ